MLVLISGPSGCGKTTIIRQIVGEHPEYIMAHSTTTRAMRLKDNESQGNPYHFVDNDTFDRMVAKGEFFEWNNVHDNRYGLTMDYIELAKKPDVCVIKDIDVEGHMTYLEKLKDTEVDVFSVYIGVAPDVLTERLIKRGDEFENIKLRLSRQKFENSFAKNYDFVVQNVDRPDSKMIAKCVEYKIQEIMDSHKEENTSVKM